MTAVANPGLAPGPVTWTCPFKHPEEELCLASTPCDGEYGFVTSPRCDTEHHETCPLYLAKVLRGLRPLLGCRGGELAAK